MQTKNKEEKGYIMIDDFSSTIVTKDKNTQLNMGNKNTYKIKPLSGILLN